MKRLLLALLVPWMALAQAPIQRNPWSTNVTGNPVRGVNNLIVTNVGSGIDWQFYGSSTSTVARLADLVPFPLNVFVGTNTPQYRVPMVGDGTSTNYISGPIIGDATQTNASVLGILTAHYEKITNNLVVGTGTSPGTTMVDIGPAAAGTNAVRINGGVQTASSPPLVVNETFNNGAVTFNPFQVSVTNTASAANSLLADFQSGAAGSVVSKLAIRASDGAVMVPSTNAFILDDTGATAGNARGNHAVDLQFGRNAATKVASGKSSVISGGTNNTASGDFSTVIGGLGNIASGLYSSAFGGSSTASGSYSLAVNQSCQAVTDMTLACGYNAKAGHWGEFSHASAQFSTIGDGQFSLVNLTRSITTGGGSGSGVTNTWCELFLDGDTDTKRMTLPTTNSVWTFRAQIVAKATTAGVDKAAGYTIEGVIKKTRTTTSIVGSPVVTTLAEDDALWNVRVSADDTNDSLLIEVYSDAEPTRWVATVTLTQVTAP